jgi:hypothetical protein
MPFSLNLRHDLAVMSEAQLAERLKRTLQDHSLAEEEAWPYKVWASFRGPVRHPLAYPFLSWIGVSYVLAGTFGPAFGFSVQGLLPMPHRARHRALMRMHLALCETRDITDEIKRRVDPAPWLSRQ